MMPRTFWTYAVWVLPLLGISSPAYADIEALQGAVLGPIQSATQEVKSVQEQLNELQSELRSAAEGVSGAVKDVQSKVAEVQGMVSEVQGAVADPQGALSSMGSKMPGILGGIDINDQAVLQDAIKQNYFSQLSKSGLSSIKDTVKNSTSAVKSKVESSVGQVSDVSKTVSAASANLKTSVSNVTTPQTISSSQMVQSASGVKMVSQTAKANLAVSNLNSMKQVNAVSNRAVSATPMQTQISTPVTMERMNVSDQAIVQSVPMTSTGKVINRQAFGAAKQIAPLNKAVQGVEGIKAPAEKSVGLRANVESLRTEAIQSKETARLANTAERAEETVAKELAKTKAQAVKAEVKAEAQATRGASKVNSLQDSVSESKAAIVTTKEKLNAAPVKSSEIKDKIGDIKESLSEVKAATPELKSEAVKSSTGFRQRAIINKDVQSLDKGAWLNKVETVKLSSYKSSETLAFGAEDTDMSKIVQEQAEKMAAIQRESFASLYAQAFTIRTNLYKEKAEEDKKGDTREIIQATKNKALVMSKRLRRIMLMNAGLFNFKMSQLARQYSVQDNEEEDDE